MSAPPAGSPPRYAMYIEGKQEINSETGTNKGSEEVREYTLKRRVDADYDQSTAWPVSNRIRVGSTAPNLAVDVMPFEGSIYYVALYRKPLSADEVKLNYDAGYANSEPVITDRAIAVLEDTCTPLVSGPTGPLP